MGTIWKKKKQRRRRRRRRRREERKKRQNERKDLTLTGFLMEGPCRSHWNLRLKKCHTAMGCVGIRGQQVRVPCQSVGPDTKWHVHANPSTAIWLGVNLDRAVH